MVDHELEVGAVVGRSGRDLSAQEAEEHIAGFVVLDDFSARDVQRPSGPSYDLRMEVRVNGELLGSDRLDSMAWRSSALAAYAHRGSAPDLLTVRGPPSLVP